MDNKQFKNLDDTMMKKMEILREKKIADPILRGFSASVERRISGDFQSKQSFLPGLAWAPVMAVMVLASLLVLRSPMISSVALLSEPGTIQLAQVVAEDDVQEEIAVLSELGVLDEYEDAELLGDDASILDADVELTQFGGSSSAIA